MPVGWLESSWEKSGRVSRPTLFALKRLTFISDLAPQFLFIIFWGDRQVTPSLNKQEAQTSRTWTIEHDSISVLSSEA